MRSIDFGRFDNIAGLGSLVEADGNDLEIYQNPGLSAGAWTRLSSVVIDVGEGYTDIAIVDPNNEVARDEVVVLVDGEINVYEINNALDEVSSMATDLSGSVVASAIAVADIDDDDNLDILYSSDDKLYFAENNPGSQFQSGNIIFDDAPFTISAISTGDVNDDDLLDILLAQMPTLVPLIISGAPFAQYNQSRSIETSN